jgi:hypothetical protein
MPPKIGLLVGCIGLGAPQALPFFDCICVRLLLEKARNPGQVTQGSPIYFSCADIALAVRELA